MIGQRASLGTGFRGLTQYLLHGRSGASPDRSVWVSLRNVPTTDPERAAAIMQGTAHTSELVERPVYHLSVSLAPGERLDRPALEAVADRLLTDLGLDQHQAMIAEHRDGAQQHIHLMVNRVHPDTGLAWWGSHDFAKVETSLRRQEVELGLRIVPGRHAPVPDLSRHVGGRDSTEPFTAQVRGLAGDALQKATGWQELHAGLARHGLRIQPSRNGRGLVVTDGRRFSAVSKVTRSVSRSRLEARLGRFEPASPELGRLQEVSRQLATHDRLETIRTRWAEARRDLVEGLQQHQTALGDARVASRELSGLLRRVYRNPSRARQRLEGRLRQDGFGPTMQAIRHKPVALGRLRGRRRDRRLAAELARSQLPGAVREHVAARSAAKISRDRLRPYRAHPNQPLATSARRAERILARGLRRLERIESRLVSTRALQRQGAQLARRVGWRTVARLVPHPAVQALRIATTLARTAGRGLGRSPEL